MITRHALTALDRSDPLAHFRDLFTLPDGVVYLDGNSLGALPRAAQGRIASVVSDEWGRGLIRSWNEAGWIDMPARIAGKIADSTSVNLFKLLSAALHLRPDRRVIVTERANFPTDIYIAEGLARLLDQGHMLRLVEPHEIMEAIDEDIAVVMLTHVSYHTGAMLDMASITARAHEAGALMLWDLAHSAGAVPVDLAAADADMAVGCGYKFLNGGPGAPAFLYVAERLHPQLRFPLTGWLGHAAPFAFEHSYRPAPGMAGAIVGTPPMLSLAALEVGVDIALRAPVARVREKSLQQTTILADLVAEQCAGHDLELVSPIDPSRRGSQVCFRHEHAYPIMQALIARGVIGDFRAPDILRFGITPLYLGFADLWDAVQILRDVLTSGEWRNERFQVRNKVT